MRGSSPRPPTCRVGGLRRGGPRSAAPSGGPEQWCASLVAAGRFWLGQACVRPATTDAGRMQVAFYGGIPRDGRRRAPSMLWVLKRLSSHARSEWMRWRPTTGGCCDIRSSSERSPRMGLAPAHHRPLCCPPRPTTTGCARAWSDVATPGRNPPSACPPRQGKTGARRLSGSPPQAEAHRAPASCGTRADPLAVARGALTASRRSRTCRRVWQRCPGGVHRAATQRSTGTPPLPDRGVGGRTGLSPRRCSRSGVRLRCPGLRGVGDGGGTRRSPSAPYPGGDASRAWPARWVSAASCPPATRRGGLRSTGAG